MRTRSARVKVRRLAAESESDGRESKTSSEVCQVRCVKWSVNEWFRYRARE